MSDQPEALRLADVLEQQAAWEARYGPSELEELLPDSATLLRRQHAEIESLKAERDTLRGILCRMVQLAEFWINREDIRGYSARQYKTWHALGYGSSTMRAARLAIVKTTGCNDE